MNNALTEAQKLGLDTVQVFTKNQQQWKVKPLEPEAVQEWTTAQRAIGWDSRTVSHASYLINLASCNDELWEKSIDVMRVEIERCEQLHIPFLVHHPGSFVGWTLEKGLSRIAEAYRRLFKETAGYRTVSCIEGTVGAGSTIGGKFEELAGLRGMIVAGTGLPMRIGFCLDTCHMHAAGYDMSSRESAVSVLNEFDRACGMAHLHVMHINDSKGRLASKLDRHEHIGQGWVGGGASPHSGAGKFSASRLRASGFAAVVNHPRIAAIPKIMETPKEKNDKGAEMDAVNLGRLRSLADRPVERGKTGKSVAPKIAPGKPRARRGL